MRLASLGLGFMLGCSQQPDPWTDADGDGLPDIHEGLLGSDPSAADTDGDGLTDGEEVAVGTSPTRPDTDGDSYLDPHELSVGTDPLDPASRIYQGYWPYNPDKAALTSGGVATGLEVGDVISAFSAPDQFGDMLDLYDLAAAEAETIIVHVNYKDAYDTVLEEWVAGQSTAYDACCGAARAAIDDGRLLFVTVLVGKTNPSEPPTADDAASWHLAFGHPNVPVLADEAAEIGVHLVETSGRLEYAYTLQADSMTILNMNDTLQTLEAFEQ